MHVSHNSMNIAAGFREEMVTFLRHLIAIPAESCREEKRCRRVLEEYRRLGFDDSFIDTLGNVVARIGHGSKTILMDGHIDCVGVGDRSAWIHDPFQGKREQGMVFGRGAVDELPAIACMAYAAKMCLDHGLPEDIKLVLCASVMEEDCDGYALQHLVEAEGIRPDAVILGEPTDLNVYRGHRGRMEMTVTTKGVSAHGAHVDRGVNAIYKMAPIISDIEALNDRLSDDPFLGKGSITVAYMDCKSPSLCAVPDLARIYLDRRLTAGETAASAIEEIQNLEHLEDAQVDIATYDATSWRGMRARQEKTFPTWVLPEEHPLVQDTAQAVSEVLGRAPRIWRWTFSTNGVATMGRLGIPTVGFAPGLEELSHSTQEWVFEDDLVKAAAVYHHLPRVLAAGMLRS